MEQRDGGAEPNNAEGQPRVIRRRNRQPLSCTTCRERKIWCDRTVPCSQCLRRGIGNTCHIENRNRGPVANKKNPAPPKTQTPGGTAQHEVAQIKARLEQLEALIVQQRSSVSPQQDDARGPYSSDFRDAYITSNPNYNVTNVEAAKITHNYDAEAAAILLEGLTMNGALALHTHQASDMLREKWQDTDKTESCQAYEGEGLRDPIEAPRDSFGQCLAAQEPEAAWPHGDEPTTAMASPHAIMNEAALELNASSLWECPARVAGDHRGAFRLYSLTESSLGWGLGWAMAAGEEFCHKPSIIAAANSRPGLAPQRLAVLTAILYQLPNHDQAKALMEIFERRVLPFTYNVVHMPTLRKELAEFYSIKSRENQAVTLEVVDTCWLGVVLMIFTLALQFMDKKDTVTAALLENFNNPRYCALWHSATKTVLVLSGFVGSSQLSVLQTILLLSYQCIRTTETNPGLIRIAINNAQGMGLHRLGDHAKQPPANASSDYLIRLEIAKRIWWALVLNDWREQTKLISSIPGLHSFNTPIPGNYNDADMASSTLHDPRPRMERTEMSYFLSCIDLACIFREHCDLMNKVDLQSGGSATNLPAEAVAALDKKYRMLLTNAPILTAPPILNGDNELFAVERWAFEVSVFTKLVQLHRNSISNQASRSTCITLAQKTLKLQKEIRMRSDLPDLLIISVLQTFTATIILCLDLIYMPPSEHDRWCARCDILDGLQAMSEASQKSNINPRGIRIVEVLLEEEQKQWDAIVRDGNQQAARGQQWRMLQLARRVARASNPLKNSLDSEAFSKSNSPDTDSGVSSSNDYGDSTGNDKTMLSNFPGFQSAFTRYDPFQVSFSGTELPPSRPSVSNFDFDVNDFLQQLNGAGQANEPTQLMPMDNLVTDSQLQSDPSAMATNPAFVNSQSATDPMLGATSVTPAVQVPMAPNSVANTVPDMDGFWDWILSRGMEANSDISFATTKLPSSADVPLSPKHVIRNNSNVAPTPWSVGGP